MKIVIFEKEHFEGAYPVIRLFDQPGNQVTVFTTPETHQRFLDLFGKNACRYQWVMLATESKRAFFHSLLKELQQAKPDLLYLNTISDNHLLYAWVLRYCKASRTIMTVHDINCLFASRAGTSLRQWIIHWGKKKLVRQINEFNVVSDTMLTCLATHTHGKPMHNVPGAVYDFRQKRLTLSDRICLVIPGSIDRRRRDYEQVFELAGLCQQRQIPVELVLLGGPFDNYGEEILRQAKQWQSGPVTIKYFETKIVDQAIFDQYLDAAHFVWIPSVIHTKICGSIPEEYGITKSSGNIFDVIKHARPFIAPLQLTIPADLKAACFAAESCIHIAGLLEKLIQYPQSYLEWQVKAEQAALNYTIPAVRSRNASLFQG